jgi:hypothetical protein
MTHLPREFDGDAYASYDFGDDPFASVSLAMAHSCIFRTLGIVTDDEDMFLDWHSSMGSNDAFASIDLR